MQTPSAEIEVIVPCVEGSQHPVRLRVHDWERWEVVENPCSALLGRAFALMSPCSAYVRERGDALRRAVAEALSQAGSPAVPALINALGDKSSKVRSAACVALGAIRDAAAVPALIKALGDKSSKVRSAACVALGAIGDASAVPALVQALGDGNEDVCFSACEALVRMGSPAVPALIKALGDRDEYVRSVACEALGAIGDASAVPALRVHAECSDAARQALQRLGGAAFPLADAVRQLLAQPDWWGVLGRALPEQSVQDTLVAMGSPAVPALVQALGDEDEDVRFAACEALGAIGDASAVPALLQALGDGDWSVRSVACRALGAIGDASAVPALIQALGDRNEEVRSAAREALKRLGYDRDRLKREYGIRF